MKIITITDLKKILSEHSMDAFFKDLFNKLKEDFSRWEAFDKRPRMVNDYGHGVLELMPIADDKQYGFKFINGHPINVKHGKISIVSFGALARVSDGFPILISEFTILTALRTAAMTALVSSYFARKDAETLAIIGTGAQAEFLVLAHKALFPLKNVHFFDIDPLAEARFAKNLEAEPFGLIKANSAQEALKDADIVLTATANRSRQEILKAEWLKPGLHIAALGGDCPGKTELNREVLEKMDKIVVEYLPQSYIEGEIQVYSEDELKNKIHAELWEVFTGKKSSRENDQEITLFDSVGFALEDFSTLRLIDELSSKYNIAQELDMIPTDLSDPRNLFGLVQSL